MAIYQPKNTAFYLPEAVYMKTLYSILDYERMKSDLDGCPHNRIEVAAVEMALNEIPEQYKQAIWNNIFYKEKLRL